MENFLKDDLYKINPVQITIDISGECNAKCPFCIRQVSQVSFKGFMEKEIFYKIIEQVQKIESIKIISLSAYGEPLLHPNFDEFVNYLATLNYNVLVITNMSLAHKHFESLLKLTHIMFSIEGHDKNTYEKLRKNLSFNRVFDNVKKFDKLIREKRKKGERTPSRAINFIATKKSNINKFIKLWDNYADFLQINAMDNPPKWNNELQLFEHAIIPELESEIIPKNTKHDRNNCMQPFSLITIRPDGNLGLCCNDSNSSFDFGNYKDIKKSFFENEKLNLIREELKNNKLYVCKNCTWNYDLSKEYISEYLPDILKIQKNYQY